MKITDAKVYVCSPTRNFVTLQIWTEDGLYGLGDATLNGRELSVASYLRDHLVPCLIGRDATEIEDIWQYCYRGAYWRRGPVTMAAIAAIDMALWDLLAKSLNVPLYKLLGGKSRYGIMVYGHANGESIDETVDQVGGYLEKGYKAIRAQCAVPGVEDTYGVSADKMFYEPAKKGLPPESHWSTERYINFIPKLFDKLREAHGDDPFLLHDCHHRLTPIQAARLGKELEPYHLYWMEDAVNAELQESFRWIRHHTTTPLAVGEVFNTIWDCHILLSEQLIDHLRMSIVHGGGITPMKKIAGMAELYHVLVSCHGPTDVSPITMAAQIHFNMAINNFGLMEFMRHADPINEVFPHNYYFEEGFVHTDDTPGLGVDFDSSLADQYPYERAYLPINRKLDGTLYNW